MGCCSVMMTMKSDFYIIDTLSRILEISSKTMQFIWRFGSWMNSSSELNQLFSCVLSLFLTKLSATSDHDTLKKLLGSPFKY
jgi:hypothetical protein